MLSEIEAKELVDSYVAQLAANIEKAGYFKGDAADKLANAFIRNSILIANKGKIKVKKPKKWLYPMTAERTYIKELKEINRIFYENAFKTILPSLEILVAQAKSLRSDSEEFKNDYSWIETIKQLTDKTYYDFSNAVGKSKIESISAEQANRISLMNKEQFVKVVHSAVAVNPIIQEPYLQTQLKLFQSQNTDLITKMGVDQRDRLQQTLYTNLSQGHGQDKIKEEIKKSEGIGDRRAKLIARDQTNKFNGQLSQLRQNELGIGSYIWTTARDERVRPTHRAMEGKIVEWNKPPSIGHPGSEINCRCIAQPVITDEMFTE